MVLSSCFVALEGWAWGWAWKVAYCRAAVGWSAWDETGHGVGARSEQHSHAGMTDPSRDQASGWPLWPWEMRFGGGVVCCANLNGWATIRAYCWAGVFSSRAERRARYFWQLWCHSGRIDVHDTRCRLCPRPCLSAAPLAVRRTPVDGHGGRAGLRASRQAGGQAGKQLCWRSMACASDNVTACGCLRNPWNGQVGEGRGAVCACAGETARPRGLRPGGQQRRDSGACWAAAQHPELARSWRRGDAARRCKTLQDAAATLSRQCHPSWLLARWLAAWGARGGSRRHQYTATAMGVDVDVQRPAHADRRCSRLQTAGCSPAQRRISEQQGPVPVCVSGRLSGRLSGWWWPPPSGHGRA